MEYAFSHDIKIGLKAKGHEIVYAAPCGMGATVALKNPKTGVLAVGADPRRACYAIGL